LGSESKDVAPSPTLGVAQYARHGRSMIRLTWEQSRIPSAFDFIRPACNRWKKPRIACRTFIRSRRHCRGRIDIVRLKFFVSPIIAITGLLAAAGEFSRVGRSYQLPVAQPGRRFQLGQIRRGGCSTTRPPSALRSSRTFLNQPDHFAVVSLVSGWRLSRGSSEICNEVSIPRWRACTRLSSSRGPGAMGTQAFPQHCRKRLTARSGERNSGSRVRKGFEFPCLAFSPVRSGRAFADALLQFPQSPFACFKAHAR